MLFMRRQISHIFARKTSLEKSNVTYVPYFGIKKSDNLNLKN